MVNKNIRNFRIFKCSIFNIYFNILMLSTLNCEFKIINKRHGLENFKYPTVEC